MKMDKIIIRPDDPIERLKDPIGDAVLYLEPFGVHQINEVSDYITHKDDKVKYHIHHYGSELFIITKGSVEAILGGKRCIAEVGDMMLIKPFTPHAFRYREDGTTWQEVIQKLSLYNNERAYGRVFQNFPEKLEDPAFIAYFQAHNGRTDYSDIVALESEIVDKKNMPGFVAKDGYYKKYSIPGGTALLKYPKWDLEGIKEVWEFILEKGTRYEFNRPYAQSALFILRKGSILVEVQGLEPMTAKAGDIISIPSYTTHSLTVLEPETVLDDFNCQSDLFLMMEDMILSKSSDSLTHDRLDVLLDQYQVPVTAIRNATGSLEYERKVWTYRR